MVMFGEDLVVVTPSARTGSGSRGSACATRFWTWIAARSMSVPSLKVTERFSEPSDAAADFM